jgi:hypothetical protein
MQSRVSCEVWLCNMNCSRQPFHCLNHGSQLGSSQSPEGKYKCHSFHFVPSQHQRLCE